MRARRRRAGRPAARAARAAPPAAPPPRSPRRSRSRASTRRAAARRGPRRRPGGASPTRRRNSSPIARVGDRLELLARLVVDERLLGERGAVERAVGREDVGPEASTSAPAPASRARPLRARSIGVDHDRAPLGEQRRDRRLARPDAAREPDHEHARSLRGVSRRLGCRHDAAPARSRRSGYAAALPISAWSPTWTTRPASPVRSMLWHDANRPKESAAWRPRWRRATPPRRARGRLVRLTVTTRWATILAGIIFGFLRDPIDHFALASIALLVYAGIQTIYPLQPSSPPRLRVLVLLELALTVGGVRGNRRPRQPVRAHPDDRDAPRRLRVGSPGARRDDRLGRDGRAGHARDAGHRRVRHRRGRPARRRLPAVRGARRLRPLPHRRDRGATRRRARPGRRWRPPTSCSSSLHALAQTLPASLDLGEVVESTRTRLRSLFRFSALASSSATTAQSVGRSSSRKACGCRRTCASSTSPSRSSARSRAPTR